MKIWRCTNPECKNETVFDWNYDFIIKHRFCHRCTATMEVTDDGPR